MDPGRRSVAWMLSIGSALLAAASTAHVAPPPVARPSSARPAEASALDLAAVIRDDAPLPVAMTDTPAPASAPAPEIPRPDEVLIEGSVEDVFYGPPGGDPVRRAAVAQALKLFAHRFDMTRDVALGDRVRLLVRRGAPEAPPEAAPGTLLDYAEFDGASVKVRFFRDAASGPSGGRYVDEAGVPLDRFLLRTPLAITRITSGFGPRLHPLLGYTRLHRGVDFGAASGTPVLAAADGVVGTAGWDGGYGRRIVLRHAGALDTLYAHLSRIAPGLAASAVVRQGQVIGWTGDSGQVTGPHLHFEVRSRGVAVDPSAARPPAPSLSQAERSAFEIRKRAIVAGLAACAAKDGAARCVRSDLS